VKLNIKLALYVILIEVLILGGLLAFLPKTGTSQQTVYVQTPLCSNSINNIYEAGQGSTYSCPVTDGSWAVVSLNSKPASNISFSIILAAPGGNELVYSSTGVHFDLNLPFTTNSTAGFHITNGASNGNTAQGVIAVYELAKETQTLSVRILPYRDLGVGIVGAGLVGILILFFDPSGRVSRALKKQKPTSSQ
jgi:hypothetical protein